MIPEKRGALNAAEFRFAIVVSRFNEFVTERLLNGALEALRRAGAVEEKLEVVRVPGSFELPLAAEKLAESGRFDAIICLGALIKGETPHFDFIASEVTRGIGEVALKHGLPVAYGVLTTETSEQAMERAGLKMGNKGAEAALSAVEMVSLLNRMS